jgi:cysteine desulfurase/selenocysteine lyase
MSIDEEEVLEEIEDRIDEHVNDPYHRGHCSECTHMHEGDNPLCGDRIRMELKVDDRGTMQEVYFDGRGCRISQAAASMLVERFNGRSVEEVKQFTANDMLKLFGARLTPNRQKCVLLSWRVLQAAVYSPVKSPGNGKAENASMETREPVALRAEAGLPPVQGGAETSGGTFPASAGLLIDTARLRADFPILSQRVHGDKPLIYLDNAATSQRPRQVIQAIVEAYEKDYGNIHRGIHTLAERATELFEQARCKVAQFLGAASPGEIVFTSGATAAINLVARSWGDANLRAGDEILVTEMEHHSNLVPWHQLAQRTGAVIRWIPLTDDGRLDMDALDRVLGPRTRLVAVTAVSNVLGTINPVEEIIRRAHEVGAVVLVDGAQSVPHQKTNVAAMNCDFLALSGHKMLGPTGIGVLYAKRELLERMPPFLGGGGMIRSVWVDRFEPAGVGDAEDPRPARFEAGTPPIVPAIGLGVAIDYLQSVGLDAIHEHERTLTLRAHRRLESIPGLRILGPEPAAKAGIVSFVLADQQGRPIHGHDVAEYLDRRGIAVRASHHCAEPLHRRYGLDATVRASFYFYNTPEEIDALGESLVSIQQAFQKRK